MAKINIIANEFPELVVPFLLDKLLHPEEIVPGNKEFNELSEILKLKGMQPILMKYYLKMDANQRLKYKRIKDIFDMTASVSSIVNISPGEKEVEVKKTKSKMVGKIIRKLIGAGTISKKEMNLLNEYIEEEVKNG